MQERYHPSFWMRIAVVRTEENWAGGQGDLGPWAHPLWASVFPSAKEGWGGHPQTRLLGGPPGFESGRALRAPPRAREPDPAIRQLPPGLPDPAVSEVKCLGAGATRTGTPAPRVRAARVSPQRPMFVFSPHRRLSTTPQEPPRCRTRARVRGKPDKRKLQNLSPEPSPPLERCNF